MFVMIVEMVLTAVSYGLHIYITILLIFLGILVFFFYRMLRFPRPTPYTVKCFLKRGTLTRNSPIIIAHRGGALNAPENTLAAFKLAKENGATGVEFDLDFTKDGVPVIIHDSTVDRTTDGTGKVSDFTYEEIKRLNASVKHPLGDKFPNECIPHLHEVVDLCLSLGLQMYIDIKAATQANRAANTLKDIFASHQLYDKAMVCSFYPNVIFQMRRADPNVLTALTWRKHIVAKTSYDGPSRFKEWWKQLLTPVLDRIWELHLHSWVYDFLGVSVFLSHAAHLSRDYVKEWQDKGVSVVVWTVNDPAEKDYFTGVLKCPIMTDCMKCDNEQTSA